MRTAFSMFFAFYVHHLSPFLIQFNDQLGIRWYGLAYIAGFIAAFYLMKWLARNGYGSLREDQVGDFVFYAALFGVLIGGRLGYVLFYRPSMLSEDPLGIFRVWDGGMASHGGIIGLIIFSAIYARRHHISWTGIGDNLVAVAPIGLFCGRIANFVNGELYGRTTTVPWAIQFPAELLDRPKEAALAIEQTSKIDASLNNVPTIIAAARHSVQVREILAGVLTPRHPSQLYEAFLEGALLFALLIFIRLKFKKPDGVATGCFFLFYPIMRIIGEAFREPDAPLTGPFTRGQFLSLFMFIAGIGFLWSTRRKYVANRSL
ncbi:MAG: prolipoprotein diacylglyceryl transferase [Verrucomicrobia bacterium]|nr:prolipoprotein diacylglyceryl transferase [Verrucomicrobiota bacterium]MBV9643639.1 prolipoprotein diacylglyceryl transferase [Verrucomicrobiota bacterium]